MMVFEAVCECYLVVDRAQTVSKTDRAAIGPFLADGIRVARLAALTHLLQCGSRRGPPIAQWLCNMKSDPISLAGVQASGFSRSPSRGQGMHAATGLGIVKHWWRQTSGVPGFLTMPTNLPSRRSTRDLVGQWHLSLPEAVGLIRGIFNLRLSQVFR